MNLTTAIETFNKCSQSQVKLQTTRDGRVTAVLPRVGREIIIEGSTFNKDVKITVADIAWLCEEARRALSQSTALLEAGLNALQTLNSK